MTMLIARQPVFARDETLFGYELTGLVADSSGLHSELSPSVLISELFLDIGVDRIAPNERLFIPLDRDLILGRQVPALPFDRTVLEIPANVEIDADLVAACAELRSEGFWIMANAVDPQDATRYAMFEMLAATSDIVKIDLISMPASAVAAVAARCTTARLIGSNVRNRAERDRCITMGFELFAGTRFAAPEKFSKKVSGIEHLLAFQALQMVRDPSSNDDDIEALVRRDVGLSYRLLRMVNSAGVGGREISSIGHALRLLGRTALTRWLYVLMSTQFSESGVRQELFRQALVRARMCESLADALRRPMQRGSLFLIGMLSVFDRLLEAPMDAVCESLDLAPEIKRALTKRDDEMGVVLALVQSYVEGDWGELSRLSQQVSIDPNVLRTIYVEAINWTKGQTNPSSPDDRMQRAG